MNVSGLVSCVNDLDIAAVWAVTQPEADVLARTRQLTVSVSSL